MLPASGPVKWSELGAMFGARADNKVYFSDYLASGGRYSSNINFSASEEAAAKKKVSQLRGKGKMAINSLANPESTTITWTGENYTSARVTWPGGSIDIPYGTFTYTIPGLPENVAQAVTILPLSATGKRGNIAPSSINVTTGDIAYVSYPADKQLTPTRAPPQFSFQLHPLAGNANGAAIASFKGYSGAAGQQPRYFASRGYNDRPYMRFRSGTSPTLFKNPTATTYDLNLGITFAFLVRPLEVGANNNNARLTSTTFSNGGYVEVYRHGMTNNIGMSIYGGSGTALVALTSTNTALVTGEWGLYILRYNNSTKVLDIKYKNLPEVVPRITSITDMTDGGSVTGSVSIPSSISTADNSWCTYKNTTVAVPALDFGGGYVFDQVLSDNDVLEISNTLLEDASIGATMELPPPVGTIAGDAWTKLAGETVTGIGGVTYRKYQMNVSGQPYGNGVYKAWANTILYYTDGDAYSADEWPPSGPFDKRDARSGQKAGWHSAVADSFSGSVDAATPAILVIELPSAITMTRYTLQSRAEGFLDQMPSKWKVRGSNDGTNWTTVDARTDFFNWISSVNKVFDVTSPGSYSQYRLVVYRSGGSTWLHLGEWRLFSPPAPLLDAMVATSTKRAMYALKRLFTIYTGPVLTVRRSSDNATSDFYADYAGNLGTSLDAGGTSLSSWLGGSTAYVSKWWDQSGLGFHAVQAAQASQPIYSLAKRCLDFRTMRFMTLPDGTVPFSNYSMVFRYGSVTGLNGASAIMASGGTTLNTANSIEVAGNLVVNYWWSNDITAVAKTPIENVVTFTYDGGVGRKCYVNTDIEGTNTNVSRASTGVNNAIGRDYRGTDVTSRYMNGELYYFCITTDVLGASDRSLLERI